MKKKLDELVYQINLSAIELHEALGRDLLESIYHDYMKHELWLKID